MKGAPPGVEMGVFSKRGKGQRSKVVGIDVRQVV